MSAVPDTSTALVDTFVRCVEPGKMDALADLYASDVLLDAHVPNWRFQASGREAVVEQMRSWFRAAGRFVELDVEPTAAGDLLVRFEWREHEGSASEIRSRELQVWRLDEDGRIAEQLVFCAGRWDRALVEQMAAEAPLVRP